MKIILLNYEEACLDVLPVRTDDAEKIKKGELSSDQYLSDLGYNLSSLGWMVCDDDIPVFWNGESIPYTSL